MKRRFLTVFPPFESIHVHKDVGSIPYYLSAVCGWDSHLVFFAAGDPPPRKARDGDFGSRVSLIDLGPRKSRVSNAIRLMIFLLRNGKNFDVANFYHDGLATLVYAAAYKLSNPSGIAYFKLDMDHLDMGRILDAGSGFFPRLCRRMKRHLSCRVVDLYTVESRPIHETLAKESYFRRRVKFLPNGFACESPVNPDAWPVIKENMILTVGRIGDYQKYNEVLIDALAMADPEIVKGWKVCLVGPVASEHIRTYAEIAAREHPHLADVFVFTGNIRERERLFGIYERSKIFCLTSRFESFGLVLLEAMFFGNYVISSDLPPSRDLTRNGSIGSLFPVGDAEKLRDILTDAMTGKTDLAAIALEAHRFVREEYDWSDIARALDGYLSETSRNTPRESGGERGPG